MRKFTKSILTLTLAVTLFISATTTVAAGTTKQIILSGNSQHAVVAQMTVTEIADKVYPVVESQARHVSGTTTTITVSQSVTKSDTASAEFTTGYNGAFVELSATVGVSHTESMTVGSSVAYTLKNEPSGLYRIEVVYPRYKVIEKVIDKTPSGDIVKYSNTINFAPRTSQQYKRCVRYAS